MSDDTKNLMTIDHPGWDKFFRLLVWELGFREDGSVIRFDCDGTLDKSTAALEQVGGVNIPKSRNHFRANYAHCDCEVVFNFHPGKETTTHEAEKAIQEG